MKKVSCCIEAGVAPRFDRYEGDDPAAFVVSINLKRRHMTESQRSIVAGRLANLGHGQRSDLAVSRGANLPLLSGRGIAPPVSVDGAATLFNVSPRSVKTARSVLDKGTPALVKKVEGGALAVSAAEKIDARSRGGLGIRGTHPIMTPDCGMSTTYGSSSITCTPFRA